METAAGGAAIILHGPPACGKSKVSEEIRQGAEGAVHISLDDGWGGPSDDRYPQGERRYADLRSARAPILILELGCGEPAGLEFCGATRSAGEWVKVLEECGRAIHAFRLWPDWPSTVRRLDERWQDHPLKLFQFSYQIGIYALYEHRHPIGTFPSILGLDETTIDASDDRSVPEIAEEILNKCGL